MRHCTLNEFCRAVYIIGCARVETMTDGELRGELGEEYKSLVHREKTWRLIPPFGHDKLDQT